MNVIIFLTPATADGAPALFAACRARVAADATVTVVAGDADRVGLQGEFAGCVEIRCHFSPAARNGLAKIKPGEAVTIRGVPRELLDHLHFPVDRNVSIKMKDCQLLEAAE